MAEEMSIRERGMLLLASIRAALTNGVKHYANGRLLETDRDIIQALRDGEEVITEESERVERVTTEAVFDQMKAQDIWG